jgi:hypothetical protein
MVQIFTKRFIPLDNIKKSKPIIFAKRFNPHPHKHVTAKVYRERGRLWLQIR